MYFLLFSQFAFGLCKDFGFGCLYSKGFFEKFYRLPALDCFPVYIHCDSVPLSNDNEFITTEPTKKNERGL
jgi:hypothetical protein